MNALLGFRRRFPLQARSTWVNAVLAVALAGAIALAYLVIGTPSASRANGARTTTVARGTVTATVSGTGNIASAAMTGVSFSSSGTLTTIDVKVGQVVRTGQVLATIDSTDAKTSLTSAQAQLTTSQAQYDETIAGETPQQRSKDQLAIASARLGVTSAQAGVRNAQAQLALDTAQQNQAVATAEANLAAGTGTAQQVTAAKEQRASTLMKDNQSVAQAKLQVSSARNQLAGAEVQAATDAANPTAAARAQATASLRSAQLTVTQAQTTVDSTTLRAPQAGTVLSISGTVGQTVSGGGSSTSSASSSASSSSSSGSGGGGGNTGSSTSSSSSSSSGLIVLADLNTLTVTANIAEADVIAVKVGQPAQVTLSATNTTVPGTVTAVALQSTTSNNVVQYPVTVQLTDLPSTVRLGASASVVITTGSKTDTLIIPTSAVTSIGQLHTVTVVRNGVSSVVPVQVGLSGDNGTEIVSGLSEGDTVALPSTTSTSTTNGFPRLGGIGGLGGGR